MPRSALQFKMMQDERKVSLFNAALPLFALYGPKNVSVDLIADKAKCSHGIIYHYFMNVNDLYNQLIESDTNIKLNQRIFHERKGQYSYTIIKEIASCFIDVLNGSFEEACFAILMINNTGKKSLKYLLSELSEKGQKEGDITGGNPQEIVDGFLYELKGLFLSKILDKKTPAIPSIDLLMNHFRKRN